MISKNMGINNTETETPHHRLGLILGAEAVCALRKLHVMVVGLGGVGGACVEALARCGVGKMTLIDGDDTAISNLNRQLLVTRNNLGVPKTQAAIHRIAAIDPGIATQGITRRLMPDDATAVLDEFQPDAVVDAIDDIPVKAALAAACSRCECLETASLGMGRRLDPTQVRLGDIFAVTGDPLARALKRLLRRDGVQALRVAYSLEPPISSPPALAEPTAMEPLEQTPGQRLPVGSSAFVPNAAGLAIASDIICTWLKQRNPA